MVLGLTFVPIERKPAKLGQILKALRRMGTGTFGKCVACGSR